MCGRWSSSSSPYPLVAQDAEKWSPLVFWGLGTRDKPVGLTCRVCTTAQASASIVTDANLPRPVLLLRRTCQVAGVILLAI